jgi:aminoglycoside phosphotransferase (APT) family kinase protein
MSRRDIYYWKCDRPAAFHGTETRGAANEEIAAQLHEALREHFAATSIALRPGSGQGTHLTWIAEVDGREMFLRVENGPERDGQLAIESAVLDQVRGIGVRTPVVFGFDATRSRVPFAWQALEKIAAPDLNQWFKQGMLDAPRIALEIGEAVAKWQAIRPEGFGVLDESLRGYHARYADYYRLRLDEHLAFLVARELISGERRDEILREIEVHRGLLELPEACLVHKDLALWNVLGTPSEIAAFIDFDDVVAGDPLDDLSLLGCFHDASFLERACEGYQTIRPLPVDYRRRFWLHLLRNMIVKSVIRVGAGYFERDGGFFLIAGGGTGADLRRFTLARLELALDGLRTDAELASL